MLRTIVRIDFSGYFRYISLILNRPDAAASGAGLDEAVVFRRTDSSVLLFCYLHTLS